MGEYHVFSERIGREVALRPLSAEDINDLVEAYLERAKMDDSEGIDPFTEERIEMILQRSQGNIRQVLSLCSQSLDEAVDRGTSDIDPELVQLLVS